MRSEECGGGGGEAEQLEPEQLAGVARKAHQAPAHARGFAFMQARRRAGGQAGRAVLSVRV